MARDGSRPVAVEEPRQAEVGDLWAHVTVEQDVAGLEVAVYDLDLRVLMEVHEASRRPVDDPEPCLPVQQQTLLNFNFNKPWMLVLVGYETTQDDRILWH